MSDNEYIIHNLTPPQMEAVAPSDNIWLSASAGTGKTQVLSARVLRLLLEKDVKPEDILCITFTKAGAAEMANRINKRLASWVRMKNSTLGRELTSIGADNGAESRNRARQLFASLLDAPGGGLKVMTIHSFCQSLLSSFPGEASLNAGFRAIEDREQEMLLRDALNLMCETNNVDADFITAFENLSLQHGEDRVIGYLKKWARNPEAAHYWQDKRNIGIAKEVALALVGCEVKSNPEQYLIDACKDDAFDICAVRACAALNAQWGTKTAAPRVDAIHLWLSQSPEKRAQNIGNLHSCWSTKSNTLAQSGPKPKEDYLALTQGLFDWTMAIQEQVKLYALALQLRDSFNVGSDFQFYYQALKEQKGLLDYDDLIRKSASLLKTTDMADWIRYKLDQNIDHILIDEAQDTNQAQWDIIKAISDDFYSGESIDAQKLRTIFTVGDFKQAIFGFQGTSPENYAVAQDYFDDKLEAGGKSLHNLNLSESFRSTRPILDFVNIVIENLGHQSFGLEKAIANHFGKKQNFGSITLYPPVKANISDDNDDFDSDDENWMSEEKRVLADKLAETIAQLLDKKPILSTTGMPLRAADIMILLRKRGDLASLIVARLHAKGITVAGIDRLFLSKPLAVQDLLSAIRFVLQPEDNLNLATLLTSPLLGLNHDELLQYGYRNKKISLWQHIKNIPALDGQVGDLQSLLARADYSSPYQFLEEILSGDLRGRQKLYARLGFEAEIAINELLNTALEYSRDQGQSLQGFLDWVVRGDVEIKRENNGEFDEVRVMTVHGAKGLQAPVVILADICVDPANSPDNSFNLKILGDVNNNEPNFELPIPAINKENRLGKIGAAWDLKIEQELEEHNRLLYVALTRSEEHLILAGSLGKKSKEPKETSWYDPISKAMESIGAQEMTDNIWTNKLVFEGLVMQPLKEKDGDIIRKPQRYDDDLEWLYECAPEESRPPKPLVPSRVIVDDSISKPLSDEVQKYAQRGNLIHNLFEYLNQIQTDNIRQSAQKWFERQQNIANWRQGDIIDPVLNIMCNDAYKEYFGENSRSEVPITAVVGEMVINGRIDQLVFSEGEIIAIDYKTGFSVPETIDDIPAAYLRQMAHYAAALKTIFPDRIIKTGLLYTSAPKMMMLSDAELEIYKPQT